MKNLEFCELHKVSTDFGIVILDATDKPFIVFPFVGRDPDFVSFIVDSMIGHIDFDLFFTYRSAPEVFRKRLARLIGRDKRRKRQVLCDAFLKP